MNGPCNDNVIVRHTRQGLSGHFTSKKGTWLRGTTMQNKVSYGTTTALGPMIVGPSLILSAFLRLVVVFFVSLCVTLCHDDTYDTNDTKWNIWHKWNKWHKWHKWDRQRTERDKPTVDLKSVLLRDEVCGRQSLLRFCVGPRVTQCAVRSSTHPSATAGMMLHAGNILIDERT
jgi:hypothetical protein